MDLITAHSKYQVRYSKKEDLKPLQEWMIHENIKKWYPVSSEEDRLQMTKNWIGFSQFSASLTAIYESHVVGIGTLFLMPYRKLIHHCPIYFIVGPNWWGKGVGTSIIKNLGHLAKTYFYLEAIYIEIYEGCPAFSLLKKGGFKEIMRQEKFVKESQDNYLARLIFEKDLQS